MIQEEDQIGHVLVVIKLGISLRIVQKKRKRTKTLMRAHPREINQNTRRRPVKLILVKRGIQMKKANPKKKMLQQWHSKHHLLIPQAYLKISPTMRIKILSCASWQKAQR
jgi:hypothetical protein